MIYSIPTEILNNLPIVIEQSKMMNQNNGHTTDPLFIAYRNFIIELNKHSQNRNAFANNHEDDSVEVDSVDDVAPNIKNKNSGEIHREHKDVNNNKKTDILKGKMSQILSMSFVRIAVSL